METVKSLGMWGRSDGSTDGGRQRYLMFLRIQRAPGGSESSDWHSFVKQGGSQRNHGL